MAMSFSAGDMISRAARTKIGSTGIRTYIRSKAGRLDTSGGAGGILQWVWNAALGFVGWLVKAVWDLVSKFVSWSLPALWGYFCSGVQFIWHFNWNASDEEMNQSLESAWNAYGSTLGGFLGRATGSLFVMGGVSAVFCFNEGLALHIMREVSEEAVDELVSSAIPVVQGAVNLGFRWLFNQTYQALRNYIGANPDSFYETDSELIERQIQGEITQAQREQIQKKRDALKAERKPWSFANQFENWIESFPDAFTRNFLEEFFEEGFEAIQELGYVATASAGSYSAQHRTGHNVATGNNTHTAVQVTLNRSNP